MGMYIHEEDGLRMRILGAGVMLLLMLAGCAGKQSPVPGLPPKPVALTGAMEAYANVDSRKSLLRAIRMLERYALDNPDNYVSRARLANAYTLLGAGYTQDVPGKQAAYSAAVRYAEEAMLTVPGFAHLRENRGIGFELALRQLDHRHMEAMEFYKAAQFYDYDECSGVMGKLLHLNKVQRAVAVMDRMAQIDANAAWGNNRMSQGLYKLLRPDYLGGDQAQGLQLLDRAVADNPRNIVPRWGRAKYFAVQAGDRDLFKKDLRWVRRQALDELVGYRPWNVVIQREARSLLSRAGTLFDR